MNTKREKITKGFIISGLMNIGGVLIFSKFFTNSFIPEFDPVVMSTFGLIMIVVWGLAYIAVANNYDKVIWLVGVFAVEKLIYACVWTNWMLNNTISSVFEKDTMAGIFYSIYGINDWIFFLFFSFVFVYLFKKK